MNGQIKVIGGKIKELGGHFTAQIVDNRMDQKEQYTYLLSQLGSLQYSEKSLYFLLGEFLITSSDKDKNTLLTFADVFGVKSVNSMVPLDQAINFIYRTRGTIMNLLESEFMGKRISAETLFDVIKILEPLYQLISRTLFTHYNEALSFTKFALNESNQDLQITHRELADLKRALNEATIFSISDKEDRITYVNDKFCNIYQYTEEELIGKKHTIFCSGFHPPAFFKKLLETIGRGEVWKGEIVNQAKDGSQYWLDTTIIPFLDSNGERYQHISIQYDITEKKKTEESLRKAEKLAMIGELAAGIAHEIRNPLTSIRGFVQLLNESSAGQNYTDIIIEEIERINLIVSEFMVFAKPHQVYFSECDLTAILSGVIKFLAPEAILKNVLMEFEFPKEEVKILGEKSQLKQVFLNLIKNSIEAMPNGGKIHITLEKSYDNILITIKDNGVGMDEEQAKKLGEPFFTTKQDGNGLGLMVSYKIIQNHNGTIEVSSQKNIGTSFTISFDKN
ncbi:ATP-binding protein [Bacillus sp. JJ1122]|uniref:ATP-binding protein n=1 Tax=Bacillus sp. JJ1122 TaxID=3122951 RepID=UPI002FFFD320